MIKITTPKFWILSETYKECIILIKRTIPNNLTTKSREAYLRWRKTKCKQEPSMENNRAWRTTFDGEQQSWLGCRNKHFKIGKKNNLRWSTMRSVAKKKKNTCDEEEEHLCRRRAAGKNSCEQEEEETNSWKDKSSFVGSQRYMEQLYFDGMSICGHLGFPNLFLTLTCNPTWPEIQRKVRNEIRIEDSVSLIKWWHLMINKSQSFILI